MKHSRNSTIFGSKFSSHKKHCTVMCDPDCHFALLDHGFPHTPDPFSYRGDVPLREFVCKHWELVKQSKTENDIFADLYILYFVDICCELMGRDDDSDKSVFFDIYQNLCKTCAPSWTSFMLQQL